MWTPTRVWLCIFIVQEGSAVDWDLLHFTTPVAMRQASGEWASLSWKNIDSSHLLKRSSTWCTCEVVEPPTRLFVAFTFVSADWIVAAAFLTPHIAARGAPFEFSRRLCRIRTKAACCSVAGFLKRHLCSVIVGFLKRHLAISGAVPRGTERGDQSRILADEQHGIFALGVWGMQVCIEYWVWSWNICTGGMWYASSSLLGWGSDRPGGLGGPTQ